MYEHEMIKKLYGEEFSKKYDSFVDELLEYEKRTKFFTEEKPLGNYVIMNKDPEMFTVLCKDDLPTEIKNDILSLADQYFKKQ